MLLDLDQTLVDTSKLRSLRERRQWTLILRSLEQSSLRDGAQELIQSLQDEGFRYGIVTSTPRHYAEQLVKHHRLTIQVLTAWHDTRHHKPNAEPLIHGMQVLGTTRAAYIGDAEIDRAAAEAAGMPFVGVPPVGTVRLRDAMNSIRELASDHTP